MKVWIDLMWIPIVAISLSTSAGAAAAYATRYWRESNPSQAFRRAVLATLALLWVVVVLACDWYLAWRFAKAVMAIF